MLEELYYGMETPRKYTTVAALLDPLLAGGPSTVMYERCFENDMRMRFGS